jgi:YHS domain-containing protein
VRSHNIAVFAIIRLQRGVGMTRDPVCGMKVNPDEAIDHDEYMGTEYYFCSIECAEKFEADPERYAVNADAGKLGKRRQKDVA